jgi:hypothetical protein
MGAQIGPAIAKNLRPIRPKAYTRWHLDEMVVSLSGSKCTCGERSMAKARFWKFSFSPGGTRLRPLPPPETPLPPGLCPDGYRH